MPMDHIRKTAARFISESSVKDLGLRAFMVSIYKYMTLALLLTGFVAYFVASSPVLLKMFFSSSLVGLLFMLAPLFVVIYMSARINKMSFKAAQAWFWIYSGLMGISLASIFLIYTEMSIARVFFITAATFGGMSLYGYTTKRDLTNLGSFLFMGLIGIIIASLVNIFLKSPAVYFITSAIGVLVFVGLTAYDVQRLKDTYYRFSNHEDVQKYAVFGALSLYLDFINLFLLLLRFFGNRR